MLCNKEVVSLCCAISDPVYRGIYIKASQFQEHGMPGPMYVGIYVKRIYFVIQKD